jgi:hypothetical protein
VEALKKQIADKMVSIEIFCANRNLAKINYTYMGVVVSDIVYLQKFI